MPMNDDEGGCEAAFTSKHRQNFTNVFVSEASPLSNLFSFFTVQGGNDDIPFVPNEDRESNSNGIVKKSAFEQEAADIKEKGDKFEEKLSSDEVRESASLFDTGGDKYVMKVTTSAWDKKTNNEDSSMSSKPSVKMPSSAGDKILHREFWLSDKNAKSCYECEAIFSLFLRKHHCRICGRVFCHRCTQFASLSHDLLFSDSKESIRVCNFCYNIHKKQAQKRVMTARRNNSIRANTPRDMISTVARPDVNLVASVPDLEIKPKTIDLEKLPNTQRKETKDNTIAVDLIKNLNEEMTYMNKTKSDEGSRVVNSQNLDISTKQTKENKTLSSLSQAIAVNEHSSVIRKENSSASTALAMADREELLNESVLASTPLLYGSFMERHSFTSEDNNHDNLSACDSRSSSYGSDYDRSDLSSSLNYHDTEGNAKVKRGEGRVNDKLCDKNDDDKETDIMKEDNSGSHPLSSNTLYEAGEVATCQPVLSAVKLTDVRVSVEKTDLEHEESEITSPKKCIDESRQRMRHMPLPPEFNQEDRTISMEDKQERKVEIPYENDYSNFSEFPLETSGRFESESTSGSLHSSFNDVELSITHNMESEKIVRIASKTEEKRDFTESINFDKRSTQNSSWQVRAQKIIEDKHFFSKQAFKNAMKNPASRILSSASSQTLMPSSLIPNEKQKYIPKQNNIKGSELKRRNSTLIIEGINVQLLRSSHFHIENVVKELLLSEGLDVEKWFEIVVKLAQKSCELLDSSLVCGYPTLDPRFYVKVKTIAETLAPSIMNIPPISLESVRDGTGNVPVYVSPSSSSVLNGLCCRKNVTHRNMRSKIRSPKVMLIHGAIEYHRSEYRLTSLDSVLDQEASYLFIAVNKIIALKPDVLIVEKSVARHAQQMLLNEGISLIINMKLKLLERISRLTGATIAPALDNLQDTILGSCETFRIETIWEEGGKTTLMYLDGTPVPIGCTILLRGGSKGELKLVKKVMLAALMTCYHQKLEVSILRDEYRTAAAPMNPSDIYLSSAKIKEAVQRVQDKNETRNYQDQSTNRCIESDRRMPILSLSPHIVVGTEFETSMMKPCISLFNKNQFLSMAICSRNILRDFVCEYPSLHCIDMYGSADITLGQFLIATLPLQNNYSRCTSPHCRMSPAAHVRTYMHSGVRIDVTAFVLAMEKCLPGHENMQIWTWGMMNVESHHIDNKDGNTKIAMKDSEGKMTYRVALSKDSLSMSFLSYMLLTSMAQELVLPYERTKNDGRDGKLYQNQGSLLNDNLSLHMNSDRFFGCGNAVVRFKSSRMPTYFVSLPPHNTRISDESIAIGTWLNQEFEALQRISDKTFAEMEGAITVLEECIRQSADVLSKYHEEQATGVGYDLSIAGLASKDDLGIQGTITETAKQNLRVRNRSDEDSEQGQLEILKRIMKSDKSNFLAHMKKLKSTLRSRLTHGNLETDCRNLILQISYLRCHFTCCCHKYEIWLGVIFKEKLEILTTTLFPTSDIQVSVSNTTSIRDVESKKSNRLIKDVEKFVLDENNLNPKLIISKTSSLQRKHFDYNAIFQNLTTSDDDMTKWPVSDDPTWRISAEDHSTFAEPNLSLPKTESVPSLRRLAQVNTAQADNSKTSISKNLKTHRRVASDPFSNMTKYGGSLHDQKDTINTSVLNLNSVPKSNAITILIHEIDVCFRAFRLGSDTIGKSLLNDMSDTCYTTIWDDEPTSIISHALQSSYYKDSIQNFRGEFQHSMYSKADTSDTEMAMHAASALDADSCTDASEATDRNKECEERKSSADTCITSENELYWRHQTHVKVSFEEVDGEKSEEFNAVMLRQISKQNEEMKCLMSKSDTTTNSTTSVTNLGYLHIPCFPINSRVESKSNVQAHNSSAASTSMVANNKSNKYSVTAYYAVQFEALRKQIFSKKSLDTKGSSNDLQDHITAYISSLTRCAKWTTNRGGKSNAYFAKTKDDMFVVKQLSKSELQSFLEFAPEYFRYVGTMMRKGEPTSLAKIFGVYHISIRLKGKETRMDIYVMENIFYNKKIDTIYDLKGSMRSRYTQQSVTAKTLNMNSKNVVLMDENLVEALSTDPLMLHFKEQQKLMKAIINDTEFLCKLHVMDYSLLVGVDTRGQTLVAGIIDFIRQYTWDKQLETWVKSSGIVGGTNKGAPTVTSPMNYMERFQKQMASYFRIMPDRWMPRDLCQQHIGAQKN